MNGEQKKGGAIEIKKIGWKRKIKKGVPREKKEGGTDKKRGAREKKRAPAR